MASNERIRKYLDAGTVLGQVSRGRAEEIVRELVNAGDIQRSQAQEWVDNLVERSRKSSEQVLELVRHEVATQLDRIDGKSLEAIANQDAGSPTSALVALYSSEQDERVKSTIIDHLSGRRGDCKPLVDVAKSEKDIKMKMRLVERLSNMTRTCQAASDYLTEILSK